MKKMALYIRYMCFYSLMAVQILSIMAMIAGAPHKAQAQNIQNSQGSQSLQNPQNPRNNQGGDFTDLAKYMAGEMAVRCFNNKWTSPKCLRMISESVLQMAGEYSARLEAKSKVKGMDDLRENCAAATAASKIAVPAYAMESALAACVNSIYKISQETGILPDADLYQLVIMPAVCLKKQGQCSELEKQVLENL